MDSLWVAVAQGEFWNSQCSVRRITGKLGLEAAGYCKITR